MIYRDGHFQEGASAKGAYICWLLSHSSAALLSDWIKFVGVPDPMPQDELHATVMYSPSKGLDEEHHGDYRLAMPYSDTSTGEFRKTSILGKPSEDGSLVVELMGARPLHQRHEYYRDYEGLNHSFEEFRPHVTLSDNAKACSPELLKRLFASPCQLPLCFDRERIAHAE